MKLVFDQKDIEQMLIEKAKAMGVDANDVKFDTNYSIFVGATVSFVKPEVEQPGEPA